MKSLVWLAIAAVAIGTVAAERDETLQLFTQLKRTKKGRRSGNEEFVTVVQSELLLAEEEFVRSSINSESSVIEQLSSSDAQASGPHCVAFIKQKAEIMMNLGGISYTACLNRVDDQLFKELSDASEGALTREDYDRANVLNAFRGENIFVDPARIRSKLQQRMQGSFQLPVDLGSDKIAEVKNEMTQVKADFVTCMQKALGDLQRALKATEEQLQIVCAGKQG